jgi:hypothetical protein
MGRSAKRRADQTNLDAKGDLFLRELISLLGPSHFDGTRDVQQRFARDGELIATRYNGVEYRRNSAGGIVAVHDVGGRTVETVIPPAILN